MSPAAMRFTADLTRAARQFQTKSGSSSARAPRKLIESRFRKEVGERVKSELLMNSLEQMHEEQDLSAISEPDIDLDAIEIPNDGPLTFEFDLEVRPEFEMPKWKGISIFIKDFTGDFGILSPGYLYNRYQ